MATLLSSGMTSLTDISVSGSAVQLGSALARSQGILVTAHPNNNAVVRLSGSDVTSTHGQPLGPGASYTFPVTDAHLLWAVAESGTQILCVSPV